jgi:adenine-specific DNA methylase
MVFTFHHRQVEAWDALARALLGASFVVTNVFPVRSEGKSGFHSTAGTIKWDCVLVCRPEDQVASEKPSSHRGFLHSVKSRHSKWKRRLKKADLIFGWADSLSLGYALAVQQAIVRARSPDDVTLLLRRSAEFLIKAIDQG